MQFNNYCAVTSDVVSHDTLKYVDITTFSIYNFEQIIRSASWEDIIYTGINIDFIHGATFMYVHFCMYILYVHFECNNLIKLRNSNF